MNKLTKSSLSAANVLGAIGTLTLLCVYPLFITNSYHNITVSKFLFFVLASAAFAAICAIARIASGKPFEFKERLKSDAPLPYADIFMALLLLVATVSCVTSRYRLSALSGGMGRRMGLIMFIAIALAYFFIAKFNKLGRYQFYAFGIILMIMCFYTLCQHVSFDFLGLQARVTATSKKNFVGFLGNINVYSSFVCLGSGLSTYMFTHAKNKAERIFWTVGCIAGFFGIVTANTDGGYAAFAAMFALLAVICAKDRKTFEKFFFVTFMFFFVAGAFFAIRTLAGEKAFPLSFLTKTLINPKIVVTGLLISTIFILIIRLTNLSDSAIIIIRKVIIGLLVTAVTVVAAAVIYVSFINTEIELGRLEHYLRFSDHWGTDRGFIWSHLLKAFAKFPLDKKIVGYGEETVAYIMMEAYGAKGAARLGYYFDNAHNDFIQYLVTIGISGLLSYICLIISAIATCIRSDSVHKKAIAFAIVIFVIQSLVNITQPITTPLLFVFIALTQCSMAEQTN